MIDLGDATLAPGFIDAHIRKVAGIKTVDLIPSRGGAFEIRVNDELIHSKLESHEWPDFNAIAKQVEAKLASAAHGERKMFHKDAKLVWNLLRRAGRFRLR